MYLVLYLRRRRGSKAANWPACLAVGTFFGWPAGQGQRAGGSEPLGLSAGGELFGGDGAPLKRRRQGFDGATRYSGRTARGIFYFYFCLSTRCFLGRSLRLTGHPARLQQAGKAREQ